MSVSSYSSFRILETAFLKVASSIGLKLTIIKISIYNENGKIGVCMEKKKEIRKVSNKTTRKPTSKRKKNTFYRNKL